MRGSYSIDCEFFCYLVEAPIQMIYVTFYFLYVEVVHEILLQLLQKHTFFIRQLGSY